MTTIELTGRDRRQVEHVDAAVDAASHAYQTIWKHTQAATGQMLLSRLAELIEREAHTFATIHSVDGGMAYEDVKLFDVPQACETLRYFASAQRAMYERSTTLMEGGLLGKSLLGSVQRLCRGMRRCEFPFYLDSLAEGSTLIVKSPEFTPLYGQKLGQLVTEAGFGCERPHSPAAQPLDAAYSVPRQHRTLKRVTLGLGGKSPSIVFEDANLENALFWVSAGSSANNGQVYALGSRIYVQDSIYDKFVQGLAAHSYQKPAVMGDPLQNGVTKGPIVNKQQYERILSYMEKGRQEDARTIIGGSGKTQGSSGFVENTIFADVAEDSTIVKEEVFGPVATVHRFSTEEEVIAKANDIEYGLSAAVFTENVHRADRVAAALESGQSGFGRDLGKEALESWLSVKSVKYWSPNEKANL
ncbi:uncharacterized protein ATNIH1004_008338 [Aspergillus tanneri]|uniref:aldehyde dehydrogenase (NAD(+)) n=1 Tax=Aspergillus tanneri TaxID=1220188 RepID=A0A5M9MF90_9EURO|nr:uncharacterized protein ATNIH1004_008338 [Aspergillus tanneri]KAA8644140.1 hypothetical protein ATNIH1004_008338 [Aspergillus tanneri]